VSRSPAREADSSARVCASHGVRARGRIEGETTDPVGKATTATDPTGKTRSSQRDGGSSREGRNNVDPAGKAAAATDPTKVMKGGGGGRRGESSRAGPAPVLARDDDGAGEGRSSKGEALLGKEVGGGPTMAALQWLHSKRARRRPVRGGANAGKGAVLGARTPRMSRRARPTVAGRAARWGKGAGLAWTGSGVVWPSIARAHVAPARAGGGVESWRRGRAGKGRRRRRAEEWRQRPSRGGCSWPAAEEVGAGDARRRRRRGLAGDGGGWGGGGRSRSRPRRWWRWWAEAEVAAEAIEVVEAHHAVGLHHQDVAQLEHQLELLVSLDHGVEGGPPCGASRRPAPPPPRERGAKEERLGGPSGHGWREGEGEQSQQMGREAAPGREGLASRGQRRQKAAVRWKQGDGSCGVGGRRNPSHLIPCRIVKWLY
jgi:hypothetical protein